MRKLLFVIAAAGLLLVVLAPIAAGDDDNRVQGIAQWLPRSAIDLDQRARLIPRPAQQRRHDPQLHPEDPRLLGEPAVRPHPFRPTRRERRRHRVPVRWWRQAGLPGQRNGHRDGHGGRRHRPGPRGSTAGEFGELIRAMRNGATYANVHSPTYQPGEIRGNIRRGD